MSTRSFFWASPLLCAALFVACAEERSVAPSVDAPSFARQGAPPLAAQRFYQQHNLLSDQAGAADKVDPNLVNAWGLAAGPATPWWISDNETGKSTLYNVSTATIPAVFVVPGAGGGQSAPTGLVFNGGTSFVVTNGAGTSPARFMFSSEDGTISAFRGAPIVVVVDSSASGAIYKGLAIGSTASGDRLYATNFHANRVEVFDGQFHPVISAGAFTDATLPAGYAPFGIQNINGTIYVTYALQDADAEDDVAGAGHGFVDAYDPNGVFIRRVASGGNLNSPWGLALAPADFGAFSNDLLVGNFGDGRIHAFDPATSEDLGPLHAADGPPIAIDGLWALSFGKGAANNANGPANTLFFTAGPDGESHGLFGTLVVGSKH